MNPVPPPDPFPDRYRFLSLLGEGHFGRVWLARDLLLGRHVAIKGLRNPGDDPAARQALESLRRDAAALATVNHPNVVQVHDWRTAGDDHYLVMQYVSGGPFDQRLKREGPLPWQLAARYVADVSSGVLAAHARKIVHRDIKPANILWDPERDEALLADFGVAGRLGESQSTAGTPAYMPPEASGGGAEEAHDVFSLAVTLFCLVTGELPFPGPAGELRWQVQRGLAADDRRLRDVPPLVEEVLRAGLAADPEKRLKLTDFLARLRAALNLHLADTMPPQSTSGPAAVTVRLTVSRTVGGRQETVATTHPRPAGLTRNMTKVPRSPDRVQVRTGDEVTVVAEADRDGYLTLFNVGPAGDLNLLHADEARTPAGARRVVDGIEMTPPAGRERVVAVWSAEPLREPLEELHGLAERGEIPGARQYRATRNMVRIKESAGRLGPGRWQAVVLELDHVGR